MVVVQLALEKFTGPLDLLLSLLQEQKLNINELALAEITEQYLQYLDTLEVNRAEELADFLVIGSRLLLLKSRTLLPQFALEEDEGPSLEEQLRLYKDFVEASKVINHFWQSEQRSVFRAEPPRRSTQFAAPANLSADGLRQSMLQLVDRLKPPKPLPETAIDRAVSMKETIERIHRLLKKSRRLLFGDLLGSAGNKTEVIVSFLALLELMKQRVVALHQECGFGNIVVEKLETRN